MLVTGVSQNRGGNLVVVLLLEVTISLQGTRLQAKTMTEELTLLLKSNFLKMVYERYE